MVESDSDEMVFLLLILVVQASGVGSRSDQIAELKHNSFKSERYDAQGGSLYKSRGGNSGYNDSVTTVFVDSKGRVWVGTVTGVAVYDNNEWRSRAFEIKPPLSNTRTALDLLGITESGPDQIIEGPAGTIWLGGAFGIWRWSAGRYEEVSSKHTSPIAMAVDNKDALWVIEKFSVHRYDGQKWSMVLCPFAAKPGSPEGLGLSGIAIETNGNVWIGGSVYGDWKEPRKHEGLVWVIDEETGGPPIAGIFQFDGKTWITFAPPEGLNVKWATPETDAEGRIRVSTASGAYVRAGESWKKQPKELELFEGKRWVLRKRGRAESQLLFREGELLTDVQPSDHLTGAVLNLHAEFWRSLHVAEASDQSCVWLGTRHGLYRIWREENTR